MNILVVSEKFNVGGLETHINTYYEALKEKINFVYAFSNYVENGYLKEAKIYTGLNLNYNVTIKEFCDDVNQLVEIIKKEKIDVIHVHPFYSFFAPVFAANITNIKLVYTYHGYGSINFVSGINDTLLFMFSLEHRVNKVFCVASNVLDYFKSIHNKNAVFLPNLINDNDFPIHKVCNNKKWALISRIDTDKYVSIIKFLDLINELDIDTVDIYGSGNMEKDLKKYIKKNRLENKVFLKGFINKLNKSIDNYTGVIGLGRVVQEALCMNYPTIFIGYGKVAGLITKEMYDKVKEINFVPATLDDIEIDVLKKQITDINNGNYKKYQLRNLVIKNFGINNVQKYIDELEIISSDSIDILDELYKDILAIDNQNEKFYNSRCVFEKIYSRLSNYSKNIYYKNLLISDYRYFELLDKIFNVEYNRITPMEQQINELNNELAKCQAELKNVNYRLDFYKKNKLYKLYKKVQSFFNKKKK